MSEIQEIRINKLVPIGPVDNSLAVDIEWSPLDTADGNFPAKKMSAYDNNIIFESTEAFKRFAFLLFVPLFAASFYAWKLFPDLEGALLPILVAVFFACVGLLVLSGNKKFTFDGETCRYFEGKRDKNLNSGSFHGIYAIQITVKRTLLSSQPANNHHQLNLVLNSGERINIMSEMDKAEVEHCAMRVARLVKVGVLQGDIE